MDELDRIEMEEQRLLKAKKASSQKNYKELYFELDPPPQIYNAVYTPERNLIKQDYPSNGKQIVLCNKTDKLVGVKEDERYEVITLHPFMIRSLNGGSVISEADPSNFILA